MVAQIPPPQYAINGTVRSVPLRLEIGAEIRVRFERAVRREQLAALSRTREQITSKDGRKTRKNARNKGRNEQ